MERDIDEIKQKIDKLARKYGIKYIVFKTTETEFSIASGIIGTNVETELIY